jgi:hypothetical protein
MLQAMLELSLNNNCKTDHDKQDGYALPTEVLLLKFMFFFKNTE